MALERFYTPQALARETGLNVSQCRSLIAQSTERICVSRSPDSQKKRWAISESGFNALVEEYRQKAQAERRETDQPDRKADRRRRKAAVNAPGINPDGTIMNSRQLKAAGLWNR